MPFENADALELIHAHIAQKPIQPTQLNPKIPQVISNIMALSIYNEITESAFLNADFERMIQFYNKVIDIVATPFDSVDAKLVMYNAYLAQNKPSIACELILNLFQQFGVKIPQKGNVLSVLLGLLKIKLSRGLSLIPQLFDLSHMKDPGKLSIMKVIAHR